MDNRPSPIVLLTPMREENYYADIQYARLVTALSFESYGLYCIHPHLLFCQVTDMQTRAGHPADYVRECVSCAHEVVVWTERGLTLDMEDAITIASRAHVPIVFDSLARRNLAFAPSTHNFSWPHVPDREPSAIYRVELEKKLDAVDFAVAPSGAVALEGWLRKCLHAT